MNRTAVTSLLHFDAGFELRFQSLFHAGRALAFPCDDRGDVDTAALSERARDNYRHALSAVGRDYATPSVTPRVTLH